MSYFNEELERSVKHQFETSIQSVRDGLHGLQDIRDVITKLKAKEEAMNALTTELEATLHHLEQEFSKL